ncbi:hypothetical protein BB561_005743 [Smittium simulii]|uniref:Ribosomal protein S36, mitochondrial n=1 Tax=Smittium simulii TaxID=133385 RepID=A0A2T9Y8Q3_9FUNG|nr:hypothetical protein BB561_005743 [Smittium simulii]
MKASIFNKAAVLHKHQPLIRFIGPREKIWKQKALELLNKQTPPTLSSKPQSLDQTTGNTTFSQSYYSLPEKYRFLKISNDEISAIESGGAEL